MEALGKNMRPWHYLSLRLYRCLHLGLIFHDFPHLEFSSPLMWLSEGELQYLLAEQELSHRTLCCEYMVLHHTLLTFLSCPGHCEWSKDMDWVFYLIPLCTQ
jgi:hypothetical protein